MTALDYVTQSEAKSRQAAVMTAPSLSRAFMDKYSVTRSSDRIVSAVSLHYPRAYMCRNFNYNLNLLSALIKSSFYASYRYFTEHTQKMKQ